MGTAIVPSSSSSSVTSVSRQKIRSILVCHVCEGWMAPEEILSCVCRLTCKDCAQEIPDCGQCGLALVADKRVERFHQRLCCVITHPCCYTRRGCRTEVPPGNAHEETCVFRPLQCFGCDNVILRHELIAHFESAHPDKKVLKENNTNVLPSEFVNNGFITSYNAKIYCMVQGQIFSINIIKNESDVGDSVLMINPVFTDDDVIMLIKFLFKLKSYVFKKSISIKDSKPASNEIPKETLTDWLDGESNLDICVKIRKKRKLEVENQQGQ